MGPISQSEWRFVFIWPITGWEIVGSSFPSWEWQTKLICCLKWVQVIRIFEMKLSNICHPDIIKQENSNIIMHSYFILILFNGSKRGKEIEKRCCILKGQVPYLYHCISSMITNGQIYMKPLLLCRTPFEIEFLVWMNHYNFMHEH